MDFILLSVVGFFVCLFNYLVWVALFFLFVCALFLSFRVCRKGWKMIGQKNVFNASILKIT